MEIFDRERLGELLGWPELIAGIADLLAEPNVVSPARHVHTVSRAETAGTADEDVLLLMPAWITGELIGVKAVTFFGSNTARDLPGVNAAYLVFSGVDGRPLAVIDGDELTARRTMAASALAASHLARPDASSLLVVGTGQLSGFAIEAHGSVRDYERVMVWGRRPALAMGIAERYGAEAVSDLDAAVVAADVVCCVTSATQPLVHGELLGLGAHLDLVGAFKSDMRESDDRCVERSTIFVDTRAGAALAGDLAQPIHAGVIDSDDIAADLAELATGAHPGRRSSEEITLFKSAGFALEDLAAAKVALS